jgi:6-phosphogluconate dehydrogenase
MAAKIGLTGLAVMGQNLARNIASRGVPVVVHNRTSARTDAFIAALRKDEQLTGVPTLPAMVAALERPRRIIIMVKAGIPVDGVLDELLPLLDEGDIVIDGGNSFFRDTARREARAAELGISFIGAGISGGEEGALRGPSIMPGGDRAAYDAVADVLTMIAAQVDGTPCCRWIGPGGAGHYVKMVHNGIEYADIQLIAEAYDLLRHVHGLGADQLAKVFAEWNAGELESFLIAITATVLGKVDATSGGPLVDVILDAAEQKGTGRWTAQDALELGVAAPSMTTAVYARSLSSQKEQRVHAAGVLEGPTPGAPGPGGATITIEDVRDALFASKIVAYAEGFAQLAAASRDNGWDLDLGGLATIWRGGCIIRARFLDRIRESYAAAGDTGVENLMLLPFFTEALAGSQDAWRRVVAAGIAQGVPLPAFSAALAYYDGYREAAGPANLIQGLRDYFGAHGYRRTDRDGAFHTQWAQDGTEIPH